MKHLLIRVAQRLLALFVLSASLAAAQSEPDLSAAREAAAQVIPKLDAGSWQSCEEALSAIKQLAASKEPGDKELAEKLGDLCVATIEQGMKNLPGPPEQELLLKQAGNVANALLRTPTAINLQQATSVIVAWESALPDDRRARLLRIRLHMMGKNRAEQISLSAALMNDESLNQPGREYARNIHVSALLQGRPSADDIQRAEAVVNQWLESEPKSLKARQHLLEIHHERQDWPAQYALATELLADENLADSDRKWVHKQRIEGSLKTGRTHEFNEQDWDFMLEQITGSTALKQFIDDYGQLLLGIAFAIGWLWLLLVALITRCWRSKPPGFWMVVLWSTTILYASTVIMAPLALCIGFSLLGLVFLVLAITGRKAPLGYLVPVQTATAFGKTRWWVILGWCVMAFLLIQTFTHGYAWAFEQVMGRPLEAQLVAKLLQTDTLPRLVGMVLAGGIFVPFLEEVIFRGMLQDWVGRRLPAGVCVAIVSILFGLVHGLEMAIPIAFIGLLLSLLRLRYRSLWPAILLHSLNNSAVIIALYFIPETVL